MRKVALLAIVAVAMIGVNAMAQQNPVTSLLNSPVKSDGEVYNVGEVIACSVALPATAALFDVDTRDDAAASKQFIVNELFGSFRVWEVDQACNITASWSTAFPGTTMTGVAVPNSTTARYWAVNPIGANTVDLYVYGTGVAAGTSIPLPVSSVNLWGAAVVDDHAAGERMVLDEISDDIYAAINVGSGGAFICSYINQDNTGGGAFGNGVGDATDISGCGGAHTLQATGTIAEGQVTRVGQYGFNGTTCSTVDPACSDIWSVGQFSTFVNGIDEVLVAGTNSLVIVDNVGSNVLLLQQPTNITDCQDIDDVKVLFVNGSRGGGDFSVDVNTAATLSTGMQRETSFGANGRFVFHLNAGTPNASTVTPLFDLGNGCFPFLAKAGASPAVVENNVGKTNLVLSSNYFGSPIADPAKAPTFLGSLTQAVIDTANLPAGSQWTGQSIHQAAGSPHSQPGVLSNGVIYNML